jgi:selenocysteine lyase/cysteine desulfurase
VTSDVAVRPSTDPAGGLVRFRSRFPALLDTVHLASCSQGAVSDALQGSLARMLGTLREQGEAWGTWLTVFERVRADFARLINAHPDQIALVPCASEGAFQVASTRGWDRRPGLVTTTTEFPSVAHVWLAQRPSGADVSFVPFGDAEAMAQAYLESIDGSTGLVSVPLVSYQNGARLPVEEVCRQARAAGALSFVDAYQGCGAQPVDVVELGCDFLVAGTMKYLLGLPGLAFLYVREGVADDRDPQLTGWWGRADPFAFDPQAVDFHAGARRFQVGSPPVPSIFAAAGGLEVLASVPGELIGEQVAGLVGRLRQRLTAAGESLWMPDEPAAWGPMLAVHADDPAGLSAFLAERRIVTAHRGAVVRIAVHGYNNDRDVDALCEALADYRSRERLPIVRHG